MFRGRVIPTGKWVRGCLDNLADGTSWILTENSRRVQVYNQSVGEYTGVDDVKGNPIFEGDILLSCYRGKHTSTSPNRDYYLVEWQPAHAQFILTNMALPKYSSELIYGAPGGWRVVGNSCEGVKLK